MEEERKEEIKKILQESMAKSKQRKEKNQKETPTEIEEEPKQEPVKEEIVTSKEETITEPLEENHIKIDSISKDNNYNNLLPTLMVVAILLLIAVIFSFIKDDLLKEEELEDKPIVMKRVYPKEINNENIQKEETNNISSQNLTKEGTSTVPKEVEIKKEENTSSKIEEQKEVSKKEPKVEVKETKKEPIQQRVVKIVEIERETLSTPAFKKFYNGLDYEKVTCYDYIAGSTHATNACKAKVKKFLEKNSSSIRFEIIGVLGEDDFKVFNKLNEVKIDSYANSNKLKEFVYRGLARERVLEISWNVKEVLGEDTILTPTNYYVKSQKNNKGFIIKAFK